MPGSIEEVRIAKADMFGAALDLLADVGQYRLGIHNPKLAVVNGDNRAVAAAVLASAGCLGVTANAGAAVGHFQTGVLFERGKSAAIRKGELQPGKRGGRLRMQLRAGEINELRFELRSEHGINAGGAQSIG